MAKPFAKKFYNSKAWKECRKSYINSVHGLCERCLAKGIYEPGYILHHKKYLTPDNINDPYITLNHDNLEYVCLDCHNEEHIGKYERIEKGLDFDMYGNLIETVDDGH